MEREMRPEKLHINADYAQMLRTVLSINNLFFKRRLVPQRGILIPRSIRTSLPSKPFAIAAYAFLIHA